MSAVPNMAFNPSAGLRDPVTYQSKPASGTGAGSARDQVQGRLDELKNYNNTYVAPNINSKLRNLIGVVFNG